MANLPVGNQARNPPAMLPVGVNVEIFKISASLSLSGADVQLIGKLPHGAIPLDAIFYPNPSATGIGTFVAKFGTSASNELFFGSATYSVVTRTTRRLGYAMQVSISDDQAIRYDNIVGVFTAGASLGYIGDLVVMYKMPGQTP